MAERQASGASDQGSGGRDVRAARLRGGLPGSAGGVAKVLAIRAWARVPKAKDVRDLLRAAIAEFGKPKFLVTDRGCQFKADLLSKFLRRHGILRRYGAVAKWQSVAKTCPPKRRARRGIDRFFKSLKTEYASRWLLFLPVARVNEAIHRYVLWHSCHRPHQGLGGRTPDEIFRLRQGYGGQVFAHRRKKPPGDLLDLSLVHLNGDHKLPVYRRRLAA